MWYNHLSGYLLKEGFENNLICLCVFIKKSEYGFAIIAVYVDDLLFLLRFIESQQNLNHLHKLQ
jgi:hypothetical protein